MEAADAGAAGRLGFVHDVAFHRWVGVVQGPRQASGQPPGSAAIIGRRLGRWADGSWLTSGPEGSRNPNPGHEPAAAGSVPPLPLIRSDAFQGNAAVPCGTKPACVLGPADWRGCFAVHRVPSLGSGSLLFCCLGVYGAEYPWQGTPGPITGKAVPPFQGNSSEDFRSA